MYRIIFTLRKYFTLFLQRTINYLSNNKRKTIILFVALFIVLISFYTAIFKAPASFPKGDIITIEEGATLTDIAQDMKEKNIVQSSLWLRNIIIMLNGERGVLSGDYFLKRPENVFTIAQRITTGNFGLTFIETVIPEGSTSAEIAKILKSKSSSFDEEEFLNLVDGKEGYLFPDTYRFLPNVKAKEVVRILENTFVEKLTEIEEDITKFEKPVDDVIIMASLLEKEARTTETRRTIAGILWKRLDIGMPLQVDAVFGYINGKNSFQLTLEDLDIDSPYNTYRYKGLPPTPIANPGLDSIRAAITPIETDYLYFLSDRRGNMHYSKTFEEHVRKKRLYLN